MSVQNTAHQEETDCILLIQELEDFHNDFIKKVKVPGKPFDISKKLLFVDGMNCYHAFKNW